MQGIWLELQGYWKDFLWLRFELSASLRLAYDNSVKPSNSELFSFSINRFSHSYYVNCS